MRGFPRGAMSGGRRAMLLRARVGCPRPSPGQRRTPCPAPQVPAVPLDKGRWRGGHVGKDRAGARVRQHSCVSTGAPECAGAGGAGGVCRCRRAGPGTKRQGGDPSLLHQRGCARWHARRELRPHCLPRTRRRGAPGRRHHRRQGSVCQVGMAASGGLGMPGLGDPLPRPVLTRSGACLHTQRLGACSASMQCTL